MGKQGVKKLVTSMLPAIVLSLVFGVSVVTAATINSSNYSIDGNLGGSFGGQPFSTNYKMSSIGGEAIVGNGQSGSYIIDQRPPTATSTSTMQLGVQPSGLVAYYPLDEGSGTTSADASQYQNNGTFNSTAAWDASGKLGGAVDINGPTNSTGTGAVLVPDNANLPSGNAMTIEAWVKQDAWYVNQAIASHWKYDATRSGSWALQTASDNNLRMYIASSQGDDGINYVDTAVNTWDTSNNWRHVAAVFDGTQSQANRVKIYVNGVLANSTVSGTLPSTLQNSNGVFSIGSFPGLGRAMSGSIDHVKLFNRALSASEISAEYGAQNAGNAAGLTLGTLTTGSTTSLADAIVRTNSTAYGLSIQQDHDLQSGANTIPAISGSIASPASWSEGVTTGLGFTVFGAPTLDSKWVSGASYAAIPSSSTTFYSATGHSSSVVDVINVRLRLAIAATQPIGAYSNNVTYTGTTIP